MASALRVNMPIETTYATYIESTDTWTSNKGATKAKAIELAELCGGIAMEIGPVTTDNGINGFAWFPCVDKRKAVGA